MPARLMLLMFGLLISVSAMATRVDSVGVENLEGKQLILHKLDPKESYYSLGRKYNVNPAAIIDYNRNKALKIGDIVKIPTQRIFNGNSVSSSPIVQENTVQEEFITYKVKPKETLYSIAKKFNTSIDDIKQLNKLKVSSLAVGQSLKIRNTTTSIYAEATPATTNPVQTAAAVEPITETNEESAINSSTEDRRLPAVRYGLKEIKEKGIATWMQDDNFDNSKMLALHPTAPVGTIIKITNPMTQKSTFAKVVGKFAENESTNGVIIILTKTAADLIGALDKRFQVNLVYGIPDEQ
jgi:LysM repeat protein